VVRSAAVDAARRQARTAAGEDTAAVAPPTQAAGRDGHEAAVAAVEGAVAPHAAQNVGVAEAVVVARVAKAEARAAIPAAAEEAEVVRLPLLPWPSPRNKDTLSSTEEHLSRTAGKPS
jgi:DhnA family fructose-bisphosphate aldolase class Ia